VVFAAAPGCGKQAGRPLPWPDLEMIGTHSTSRAQCVSCDGNFHRGMDFNDPRLVYGSRRTLSGEIGPVMILWLLLGCFQILQKMLTVVSHILRRTLAAAAD
jgi:hypothetical protein